MNVLAHDDTHTIKLFNGISPRPVVSFVQPISNCHHFVTTVIKYSPVVTLSAYTNINGCHGYLSTIVLLIRDGRRLMPSISLSLGIGISAKLRAVVNQSIKLPN